jgi:murein DD-endopeptidase MepM/ murein hydrolase activator NlpD
MVCQKGINFKEGKEMEVKLNGNGFFRVTSHYQAIDSAHPTAHTGIDLAMKCGTELHSPTNGIIEKVVDYGSQNIGKGIIIKTEEGERLILGHLSDNSSVHVGQNVGVGDYLGLTGTTGNSTGCHLHIGLRDGSTNKFLNPDKYFNGQDPVKIAQDVKDSIEQSMSAGEILQQALSKFSESLSDMGLNFISLLHDNHIVLQVLDTILSWIC